MATLSDTKLQIAGIGHVYTAPVDTAPIDYSKFTFNPTSTLAGVTATTGPYTGYKAGSWTWLGDTSAENLIEFETDGGDPTTKRSWDRQNLRVIREAQTVSGTVNSINASGKDMALAFPGGTYDAATSSFTPSGSGESAQIAMLVVVEDGNEVGGIVFPSVDMQGRLPTFSLEEFTEFPLPFNVLNSPTTGKPWHWFAPRPRTTAGA